MPSSLGPVTVAGPSYVHQQYWSRYQRFFPSGLRVTSDNAPQEHWWSWRDMRVHLDRQVVTHSDATVIAVHDLGSYGRMLAPYGRLPAMGGLEFVAPDLPGFGLTDTGRHTPTYRTWVECVRELVEVEGLRGGRPIVLLGFGSGGRLAYDVAALRPEAVAGVVATGLIDPRHADVRRRLAARSALGRWPDALALIPGAVCRPRVPLRWLAHVAAMVNHTQFAHAVLADPLGGGRRVPPRLVREYFTTPPSAAPERFVGPPVLLVAPAEDRWTPQGLSLRFYRRIAAPKRFAVLHGAGHLPVEEPGLVELDRALRDFLNELDLG